jgi:pyruvate kinase
VLPVLTHDVATVTEMTEFACRTAEREGLAKKGATIVIAAGMPFGATGTTNLLRIAQIE